MERSLSPSSASTLSCIEVAVDIPEEVHSTPPTSVADSRSSYFKEDDETVASGRAKRSRSSIVNYNESVLSGQSRTKKKTTRTASSTHADTNFDQDTRRLVNDGIQALDLAWSVESLPLGQKSDASSTKKSIRSRIGIEAALIKKAASAVSKTTTVLGKRGRDAVDASLGKVQALGKRASLRIRQQAVKEVVEEPAEKRIKVTQETVTVQVTATQAPIPRKPVKIPAQKRWLSQGLYVGQDPDFDPRMTESKNKLKKATLATKHRKLMPLPMFAGKRLLENGRPFQLPFDVFNPLPDGQPKPDEWRKVGRNRFVGDAGEIWRHTVFSEQSKCLCTPDMGCDEDCLNRNMFYECDSSNCNVGIEHCKNRSFEELRQRVKAGGKYNIGVEVCKTKDKGYGVRSNRTFEPNQIIVEYTGEIITPEECDRRMYQEYKDNECFYLMVFDQNMIIDATRGSIARFVNHSCEPNCRMVKWTVEGKPRMALFAGDKGIMTGEELTYDYNFDPFSSKNIQECRCGKSSCRGVLGPKQKEIKEALKPLTEKTSTKRKLQDALESVTGNISHKRRKTAVATSVKKAISTAKATAVKQLSKAAEQKALATKKINDRASRQAIRAKSKRTNVRFRSRTVVSAVEITSPTKGGRVSSSTIAKRGVVRTVRGKAGGQGRTIKVVSDEQAC